jgi:AmiR/NasT family two-component response regulator
MKILVVNALLDEVRSLRRIMGPQHEVWCANGFKSAETMFKSFKPDAVVLSISDLSPSYQLLIGALQKNERCPIVAFAPFTHLKLIQQVLDWGVDAYLSSPCDMQRIKKRLEVLLEDNPAGTSAKR